MDSFEFNKVAGAVLGTCLAVLAISIASGAIFSPKKPAKPGFEIAVKEEAPAGAAEKKEPEKPIAVLLASADPKKGEATAKQCQACHNLQKGAGAKIGPDLYNVVDRDRASQPGFNYSAAMKAKGGKWTFDELNKFLTNPRQYIPGTAMTFAGLSRETQRADVIDYLRTLSDKPVPLPKPPAAAAANDKGAAPGGDKAPAGNAAKPAAGQPAAGQGSNQINNPPAGGNPNATTQPSDNPGGGKAAPAANSNAKPEGAKTAPKSGPTGGATTNAPTTTPAPQTPPASRQ